MADCVCARKTCVCCARYCWLSGECGDEHMTIGSPAVRPSVPAAMEPSDRSCRSDVRCAFGIAPTGRVCIHCVVQALLAADRLWLTAIGLRVFAVFAECSRAVPKALYVSYGVCARLMLIQVVCDRRAAWVQLAVCCPAPSLLSPHPRSVARLFSRLSPLLTQCRDQPGDTTALHITTIPSRLQVCVVPASA